MESGRFPFTSLTNEELEQELKMPYQIIGKQARMFRLLNRGICVLSSLSVHDRRVFGNIYVPPGQQTKLYLMASGLNAMKISVNSCIVAKPRDRQGDTLVIGLQYQK